MRAFLLPIVCGSALLLTACGGASSNQASADQVAAEQRAADQQAEKARIRSSIEGVLTADAQTASIANYTARAAAMRAIDVSGCPDDFRAAYLEHIFAWERIGKVQQALTDLNSDDSTAATLAAGLIVNMLQIDAAPISDHINQIQRAKELLAEANEQVKTTFEHVQVLATSYGATLPS